MATPLPLEGDGLVENLFHYLWTTDDLGGGPRVSVPPTVIYRGSQAVAWYFTSRKSGRIKRKHRANVTAAHIEHSFTKKKSSTDIVAYYLYLPNSESTSPAIEYYDAEALREFLFKGPEIPHSSTGSFQAGGILQQFALPKGSRNSTLRAIWSPKLCLLERRVNVHAIHDARFSVYERGVTFEEGGGAEALTRPEPVRGSMLPGMVQQLCERVVDHVTRVSYHKFRIARMVLRLQVDADDRLWLLWSSSLRLQPPLAPTTMAAPDMPTGEPSIRPLDIVSDAKVPKFAFAKGSGGGPVSLSSTHNTHNPEVDEEPRPGQTRCASCAQVVAHRALLPATYKAVLAHFQHVLRFLRENSNEENQASIDWPPDERIVQQAGGVGFGILRLVKAMSSSVDESGGPKAGTGLKTWQGRELLIPPVIRYLHPVLRPEDFVRHRQDPIFLHKTVGVCERCCLVYADYATASLEANALGIRNSASAPALLRPVREKPKHAEYFDDEQPDSLLLTTTNLRSPLGRGVRVVTSKTKPPASAWKPVPTDARQQGQTLKYKTGPRSTLHSLPMAPKLPPRIETFEPGDNDALRIPDAIIHDDGSPQHQQQQREEAFFRELYQQKDTVKRGGHVLRHILEAADRLSKAKPQHRLAALGNSSQIGQSQSTGALAGAISELKLTKKPGKSPYTVVQRIRDGGGEKISLSKSQNSGNASSAKSPLPHDSKPAQKKNSKKKRNHHEPSPERARFISSREKRAAAAHRGYLVAALSDAQVQLEHIESLATLVVPASELEAPPIECITMDEQHCRKTNDDKVKRPLSSPEQDATSQEDRVRELEQESSDEEYGSQQEQTLKQDAYEGHREQAAEEQQKFLDQDGEHQELEQEQENGSQEDNELEEDDRGQEQELPNETTDHKDQGFQESQVAFHEDQDQKWSMLEGEMQPQQQLLAEDERETRQDEDENLEHYSGAHIKGLDSTQDVLAEYNKKTQGTLQITHDQQEVDGNGAANQFVEEGQDQSEENVLDHDERELGNNVDPWQGQEQKKEQEDLPPVNTIDQAETHDQQQKQTRGREVDDEDEYEDEYEGQYLDHEDVRRDQEHQDDNLQVEQSEHEDGIAAPAHNLLKQAQELLATAASSDSADDTSGEHRTMLDRDGSDDTCDSNDHSMLTPLAPAFGAHEDDSSDDAVIAADSVVAAALALPSSDESSKDASEE